MSGEEFRQRYSTLIPPELVKLASDPLDTVLVNQGAYGTSPDELVMMGVHLKYLGLMGKHVTITV